MAKLAKIPKRIAGIKIPKQIRKGALASLLRTPAGQILMAELLIVVGGAIATAANPDTRSGRALRLAMNEGLQGLQGGKRGKQNFSRSFGDGLTRGVEAFRNAMRESENDVEVQDVSPGSKKKPRKPNSASETRH